MLSIAGQTFCTAILLVLGGMTGDADGGAGTPGAGNISPSGRQDVYQPPPTPFYFGPSASKPMIPGLTAPPPAHPDPASHAQSPARSPVPSDTGRQKPLERLGDR